MELLDKIIKIVEIANVLVDIVIVYYIYKMLRKWGLVMLEKEDFLPEALLIAFFPVSDFGFRQRAAFRHSDVGGA